MNERLICETCGSPMRPAEVGDLRAEFEDMTPYAWLCTSCPAVTYVFAGEGV